MSLYCGCTSWGGQGTEKWGKSRVGIYNENHAFGFAGWGHSLNLILGFKDNWTGSSPLRAWSLYLWPVLICMCWTFHGMWKLWCCQKKLDCPWPQGHDVMQIHCCPVCKLQHNWPYRHSFPALFPKQKDFWTSWMSTFPPHPKPSPFFSRPEQIPTPPLAFCRVYAAWIEISSCRRSPISTHFFDREGVWERQMTAQISREHPGGRERKHRLIPNIKMSFSSPKKWLAHMQTCLQMFLYWVIFEPVSQMQGRVSHRQLQYMNKGRGEVNFL